MTATHRANCIDCGTPCKNTAYRCRSCAGRERETFRCISGRSTIMVIGAQAMRRQRDERVVAVKEALGYGFDPRFIAADLGIKPRAIARMLDRANEHKLARRFEHVA